MSPLTHNVGKSKKDFKPKAPNRRQAAAGLIQSSVNGSVERQVDSYTQLPQSRATPSTVSSSALELTRNNSTSSTDRQHPGGLDTLPQSSEVVAVTVRLESARNALPGPEIAIEPASAVVIAQSTETPDKEGRDVEAAVAISAPRTRKPAQQSKPAKPPISTNATISSQLVAEESSREPLQVAPPLSDRTVFNRGLEESIVQSAAKRRKINPLEKDVTRVQPPNVLTESVQPIQADEDEENPTDVVPNRATPQVANSQKTKQTAEAKRRGRLEDMAMAVVADATRGDGEPGDRGRKRKQRIQGPRKRAQTPEDAESVRIEPGVITMADLCKDSRIGKKSKRETALQARDAQELLVRIQGPQQPHAEAGASTLAITPQPTENPDADTEAGGSNRSQLRALAPSVRIVNGQLVHDESSRTIDRVALANEARGDDETVVVVDSLSHKVNSGTYLKRERKSKWNEVLTDQFYDGLRMFGTDFSMICKMFPGKSRKAVKLKFSKEEKLYPQRIKSTLLGERIPVDMEKFSKLSNTVYRDPKELESDMAEDRKRLEEEQAKEKEAMEEAARERAEEAAAEAAAESAGGEEDSSAKENNAQSNETGPSRKIGSKRAKKNGRPPRKRPPVNATQARKEARAAARIVSRVLRPAHPT